MSQVKKFVVIALVLIGLVLTGCSEEEAKPTRDQQKKEPSEQIHEPIDVGSKNPDTMAPLTGEAIDEPLNNRIIAVMVNNCLLYTSPSPRDRQKSRMPSSA